MGPNKMKLTQQNKIAENCFTLKSFLLRLVSILKEISAVTDLYQSQEHATLGKLITLNFSHTLSNFKEIALASHDFAGNLYLICQL